MQQHNEMIITYIRRSFAWKYFPILLFFFFFQNVIPTTPADHNLPSVPAIAPISQPLPRNPTILPANPTILQPLLGSPPISPSLTANRPDSQQIPGDPDNLSQSQGNEANLHGLLGNEATLQRLLDNQANFQQLLERLQPNPPDSQQVPGGPSNLQTGLGNRRNMHIWTGNRGNLHIFTENGTTMHTIQGNRFISQPVLPSDLPAANEDPPPYSGSKTPFRQPIRPSQLQTLPGSNPTSHKSKLLRNALILLFLGGFSTTLYFIIKAMMT